jgi:hypothetical protein
MTAYTFASSVEIPQDFIKQVMIERIEKDTGRKVQDIRFKTASEKSFDYYERLGTASQVAAGCTVTFVPEVFKVSDSK